jgi:hypothetical protein
MTDAADLMRFRADVLALGAEVRAHWGDPDVMHRAARRLEEIALAVAALSDYPGAAEAVGELSEAAAEYRQVTPAPLRLAQ